MENSSDSMGWFLSQIGCESRNITCINKSRENPEYKNLWDIFWSLFEKQGQDSVTPSDYELKKYYMINEQDIHYYVVLWTIVVPVVFVMTIIIGVFGNALVVYVVLTTPKLKSSTHIFLLNLALSDITFLSVCVPFQAYKYAAYSWEFGDVWCKVIQYLLYVTLYVTVWTLVCIAGIRYIIIVHTNSKCNKYFLSNNSVPICVALWIVLLILHIPTFYSHTTVNYRKDYKYCGIETQYTRDILLSSFICAYLVPLCLICVFYLLVIHHLHINRKHTYHNRHNHTARVSKIVIIVVMVFSASWLPQNIHQLVSCYAHIPDTKYYEFFRVVWHCMAYGNSLANPFIYNFVSSDFRNAFRSALCCLKCRSSRSQISAAARNDHITMINLLS